MARRKGPEAGIQDAILAYLRARRIFHWRCNTGGAKIGGRFVRFNLPGTPDILAVVRGRLVGIEVKAPGEKPTEAQAAWHARARAAGAAVIVARSVGDVASGLAAIIGLPELPLTK
jgi:hypothetical protein